MRLIINTLTVVVLLSSLSACVSKKKYEELAASKEAVDAALAETQSSLQELEEKNEMLTSEFQEEKERMNGELASLQGDFNQTKSQVEEAMKKLNVSEEQLKEYRNTVAGIFGAYENSNLDLEMRDGRLHVNTTPVTYRSGSFGLNRDQRNALADLANELKGNPEMRVLVEGHTDNVAVNADAASYKDNWELSTKRALAIVRELLRNGVDPSQVAAVGRGDTMPSGSNDTMEGKAENRRTIIRPNMEAAGKLHEMEGGGN